MTTKILTKEKAKKALLEGYKITHKYFESDEYIYAFNNMTIFTEKGFSIDADIFWKYRTGENWDTNWYIYN